MKIDEYVDFRLSRIKKDMPLEQKRLMLHKIYDFLVMRGWSMQQAHDLIRDRIIKRLMLLRSQLAAILNDLRSFE